MITAFKAIHEIFDLPIPKIHPWETLKKFFR
jgi:hypothetical protein